MTTTRVLTVALRISLLICIAVSALLFVDYQSESIKGLCGDGSGCEQVKHSAYARIAGLPTPLVGLAAFVMLFVLATFATDRKRLGLLAGFTSVAAAGALSFIGIQLFIVGAVCKWCMVVDLSALTACVVAWSLFFLGGAPEPGMVRFLWGVAATVGVVVPIVWDYPAETVEVDVPKPIARLYEPDKINVVVFTDFECPFCENLHEALEQEEKAFGDRIHLVRLMYPMPFHKGARTAAQAYLCTPEDKREEMADRLYKASTPELVDAAAIGTALGLDTRALTECMNSPRTEEQLERDASLYQVTELSGVPISYVGNQLVAGADIPALRTAVDRAAGGSGGGNDVVWMFALLGVVAATVAGVSLASARQAAPVEATT